MVSFVLRLRSHRSTRAGGDGGSLIVKYLTCAAARRVLRALQTPSALLPLPSAVDATIKEILTHLLESAACWSSKKYVNKCF